VYRALVRYGLIQPQQRRRRRCRRRQDYKRWERARAMELWQLDVMGGSGCWTARHSPSSPGWITNPDTVCLCAAGERTKARPVCDALAAALARHGAPEANLTDNCKVFTARFGPGSRRCCSTGSAMSTASSNCSPRRTRHDHGQGGAVAQDAAGRVVRPACFASLAEAQTALDAWVEHYNTMRPHQGVGDRPQPTGSRSPNQSQPSLPRRPPRRRTARHLSADPNRSLHRSGMDCRYAPRA
jgi:transposase InsO family protein